MTWIIGDIHGCYEELMELMKLLPQDEKLVFLGDYIDRGPYSSYVVQLLLKQKERSVFLMGNHEAMLLAHYLQPKSYTGMAWTMEANGGLSTLKSYGLGLKSSFTDLPEEHQEFYKNLHLFYEDQDFIAVHAGLRVRKETDMHLQDKNDLLWIRMEWIQNEKNWKGKKVYYGHTPNRYVQASESPKKPIMGENSIGLDTACVYGGYLTAIHHPSGKMVQVKSHNRFS